jgi:hypothetical protein
VSGRENCEGKSLAQYPDGDILRGVVNELHHSVQQGVPTFLMKIKSHRGEFLMRDLIEQQTGAEMTLRR